MEIGGVAGAVAPIVGKQPLGMRLWVMEGDAPALLRLEGQLYEGEPLVDVELAGTSFPK